MDARGYLGYKEQSVNTMTRGEMLLLLYNEILKRLSRAQLALNQKDYTLFNQSVKRTKDIIRYLIETLNFEYPISRDLKQMYDYFLYELTRLEAGRHPEIIRNLQDLTKELSDAYSQASRKSNI